MQVSVRFFFFSFHPLVDFRSASTSFFNTPPPLKKKKEGELLAPCVNYAKYNTDVQHSQHYFFKTITEFAKTFSAAAHKADICLLRLLKNIFK